MREQSIDKVQLQNRSQVLSKNQLIKLKGGTDATDRGGDPVRDIIIVDDLGA